MISKFFNFLADLLVTVIFAFGLLPTTAVAALVLASTLRLGLPATGFGCLLLLTAMVWFLWFEIRGPEQWPALKRLWGFARDRARAARAALAGWFEANRRRFAVTATALAVVTLWVAVAGGAVWMYQALSRADAPPAPPVTAPQNRNAGAKKAPARPNTNAGKPRPPKAGPRQKK